MSLTRTLTLVLIFCTLFVFLGVCFLPYAGIQDDEAIFANPLYQPLNRQITMRAFHHWLPLMISDHIGALKTWLYVPIFAAFHPNTFVVRFPMVLAGALTIWLLFRLTLRLGTTRTAFFAALLLATDPSFFLMDTFDWGPVALERLLLVAAALCMARFSSNRGLPDLAAASFFFGLALWNRADFLWAVAGVAVAGLLVYWPELRRVTRPRYVAAVAVFFVLGFLPLLIFNIRHPNATLGANAHLELPDIAGKFQQLHGTLDGSDLFGYLVLEESADHQKIPTSRAGNIAVWIRNHFGEHRRSLMFWATILALLAVPWWWPSKPARFVLVFMTITWSAMAISHDGGGSAHHVAMLWPAPQFFVAVVLAAIPARWIAGLAVTLLAVSNLLVVNQYLLQFDRDGAGKVFTIAATTLSQSLADAPGQTFYATDWGMFNAIVLLHQGHLHAEVLDVFMNDKIDQNQEKRITQVLSDPSAIFVNHTPAHEAFLGVHRRMERYGAAQGKRIEILRLIADANGRPTFEITRFVPAGSQ